MVTYTIINAFTTSPQGGNPASVILLQGSDWPSDESLQQVATTLNQPMTAYLLPSIPAHEDKTMGKYKLRWFNPGSEQWICGHATVALSYYVFSLPGAPERLELETIKHGLVTSENVDNPFNKSGEKMVAIDFPRLVGFKDVTPSSERYKEVVGILKESTGQTWGGKGEEVVIAGMVESTYLLIEVDPEVDLRGIEFDFSKIVSLPSHILLTQVAKSSPGGPHIHTRVLVNHPGYREEDSATGSAHCAIIPYYLTQPPAYTRLKTHHPKTNFTTSSLPSSKPDPSNIIQDLERLKVDDETAKNTKESKDEEAEGDGYTFRVEQLSKRGGELVVSWTGGERVTIRGRAVEVSSGEVEMGA